MVPAFLARRLHTEFEEESHDMGHSLAAEASRKCHSPLPSWPAWRARSMTVHIGICTSMVGDISALNVHIIQIDKGTSFDIPAHHARL